METLSVPQIILPKMVTQSFVQAKIGTRWRHIAAQLLGSEALSSPSQFLYMDDLDDTLFNGEKQLLVLGADPLFFSA